MLAYPAWELSMKKYLFGLFCCICLLSMQAQTSNNISLVNKILPAYGYACDIKLRGNIALVSGTEHALISYDVANPANPVYVDSYYLDYTSSEDPAGSYGNLLIYGNYVYYCLSSTTAELFEVSDSGEINHLITLNDFANLMNRYDMQDNRLYTLQNTNVLTIWDLQNPSAPVQIGSYSFAQTVIDLEVNGSYAYVSNYAGIAVGFQISVLDVGNPASPDLLSNFAGGCEHMEYHDGYLYTTYESSQGLIVINAADPANLVYVNQLDYPNYVFQADMMVDNGVLVIRSEDPSVDDKGTGVIYRFDLSNPTAPEAFPYFVTDVDYRGCWTVGNNALFSCASYYQISVYGSLDSPVLAQLGRISGMPSRKSAKQGRYLFLNSGAVIDTQDLDADPKFYHYCDYLCAYDEYIFSIKASYLYKWAIDPQGNPSLLSAFMIMPVEYGFTAPLHRVGTYIYTGGFFVNADFSGMTQNSVMGNPSKIENYGNYAFAAGNGIKIFDVSTPTNPQQVASLFNFTQIADIAIFGSVLIIARADIGLYFYDISDPVHPSLIVHKPNVLGLRSLEISGNYLFTSGTSGIAVYSLYNIASPEPTGYYCLAGLSYLDVVVSETQAFICEGRYLGIYDVSEAVCNPDIPELPREKAIISSYPNPFINQTTILLQGYKPGIPCTVSVYNLRGQRLITLYNGKYDSSKELVWNGQDANGKQTSEGVYLLKSEQEGNSSIARIIRLR